MSTTTNRSDIERVARQHAEAALCHLAHVAGITFDDEQFDSALTDLAADIVTNLELVEARQRSRSEDIDEQVAQLETCVAEFGRIDNAYVSYVEPDGERFRVSVFLSRTGVFSRACGYKFDSLPSAEKFREAAQEIVGRAT